MATKPEFYTAADKLAVIERELKYWFNIELRYPANEAQRAVAIFEAIAADYRTLAEKERLI